MLKQIPGDGQFDDDKNKQQKDEQQDPKDEHTELNLEGGSKPFEWTLHAPQSTPMHEILSLGPLSLGKLHFNDKDFQSREFCTPGSRSVGADEKWDISGGGGPTNTPNMSGVQYTKDIELDGDVEISADRKEWSELIKSETVYDTKLTGEQVRLERSSNVKDALVVQQNSADLRLITGFTLVSGKTLSLKIANQVEAEGVSLFGMDFTDILEKQIKNLEIPGSKILKRDIDLSMSMSEVTYELDLESFKDETLEQAFEAMIKIAETASEVWQKMLLLKKDELTKEFTLTAPKLKEPDQITERRPGAFDIETWKVQPSGKTIDNIGGYHELTQELRDLVEMLENREHYLAYGSNPPKGIMLYGPPGTGKSYAAECLAGSVKVPFYKVKAQDLISCYVGESQKNVAYIFDAIPKPAILFIDEIDSIGSKRENASEHTISVLNGFLERMSGLDAAEGLVVIGATNRYEVLDSAFTRTGRFDKKIHIGPPDRLALSEIAKVQRDLLVNNAPAAKDNGIFEANIDFQRVANAMNGLVGSDVKTIFQELVGKLAKDRLGDPKHPSISTQGIIERAQTFKRQQVKQSKQVVTDPVHDPLLSLLLGLKAIDQKPSLN